MNGLFLRAVLGVVPAILAITLHEAAHGYAALALGDDTAKRMGRLSLNPLRHIDRVGTVLLPGALLIGQLLTIGHVRFMFGWAKPVPVEYRNLQNPKRDMALVAAAGPVTNFVLAWISALLLHGLPWLPENLQQIAVTTVQFSIIENLALGLFNLLPVPPLDGGRIAVGVLPMPLARRWAQFERSGILVVLAAVYLVPPLSAQLGAPIDPVGWVFGRLMPLSVNLVLRLAGLDAGA